jgi:hypothetical protein
LDKDSQKTLYGKAVWTLQIWKGKSGRLGQVTGHLNYIAAAQAVNGFGKRLEGDRALRRKIAGTAK